MWNRAKRGILPMIFLVILIAGFLFARSILQQVFGGVFKIDAVVDFFGHTGFFFGFIQFGVILFLIFLSLIILGTLIDAPYSLMKYLSGHPKLAQKFIKNIKRFKLWSVWNALVVVRFISLVLERTQPVRIPVYDGNRIPGFIIKVIRSREWADQRMVRQQIEFVVYQPDFPGQVQGRTSFVEPRVCQKLRNPVGELAPGFITAWLLGPQNHDWERWTDQEIEILEKRLQDIEAELRLMGLLEPEENALETTNIKKE